jgi:hypothetical protein
MASKKKSKGVLERIGAAATTAAEVVIDAGSKTIHAVGDMMPAGSPQKGAKASPKASKAPKASAKKPDAKTSKAAPKASAKASNPPEKVEAKTSRASPKVAMKKTTPTKSAKPASKAVPSGKEKRPVGRKG